ncbi:peptidase associated/transthyretin-like domain-containing protein [Isoptericola aurantiacus]|uniref:hypothetical protein n=1 Tax=Isoptericola aurantiacus TaxID=3377839 RepID=UPI00383B5013
MPGPHLHFEVYPDVDSITDAAEAVATSQLALPQDACDEVYALTAYAGSAENLAAVGSLDDDNVFGDDGGALQVGTLTGGGQGGGPGDAPGGMPSGGPPDDGGTAA